jgi:hypothetical protein
MGSIDHSGIDPAPRERGRNSRYLLLSPYTSKLKYLDSIVLYVPFLMILAIA